MSDNYSASEEANEGRRGVHFIDEEEIMDKSEEQRQEDIIERQELRRRLFEAEASYSQLRETHDWLFEHGLDIEAFINEIAAENKCLISKVKEFQQQLENIRNVREEEDEEVVRQELLSEEEGREIRAQFIYIRELEKKNNKLTKKTENLTAELEQLSLGQNYQEQIQNLRTATQELQHKLEQIQEMLRSKDEEIEMKSLYLIRRSNELEENFNTIEDLRQEQRELHEQLSRRQEEHIIAAQEASPEMSTESEPLGSFTMGERDEEHKDETTMKKESRWNCLKGLWKGAKLIGQVALCVLLPVGIMTSMVSVYNSLHPDYNLWNISFGLLEPRLDYAFSSVY